MERNIIAHELAQLTERIWCIVQCGLWRANAPLCVDDLLSEDCKHLISRKIYTLYSCKTKTHGEQPIREKGSKVRDGQCTSLISVEMASKGLFGSSLRFALVLPGPGNYLRPYSKKNYLSRQFWVPLFGLSCTASDARQYVHSTILDSHPDIRVCCRDTSELRAHMRSRQTGFSIPWTLRSCGSMWSSPAAFRSYTNIKHCCPC